MGAPEFFGKVIFSTFTHTQSASVVSYKFHQEALTMTTFLGIFGEALLLNLKRLKFQSVFIFAIRCNRR